MLQHIVRPHAYVYCINVVLNNPSCTLIVVDAVVLIVDTRRVVEMMIVVEGNKVSNNIKFGALFCIVHRAHMDYLEPY